MRSSRLIVLFVALAVATAYGFQPSQSSPVNRPWPPDVQKVSDESPALSPEQALKTFYLPPGYRLDLVAAEPLVQDPIVMDWDPDGRLWVVEMPGFVPNLSAQEPNLAPIGRIAVLEDTNDDGRMDKRTVFADGLVLARAMKVLDRGVLVGEPPNAWLMHDTNGDLKMDTKELVTANYGRREARVEQNTNDFHWSLDNWMYTANGDTLMRLKDGKFEVLKTLSRGEWGVTHDDAGRIYRNTNESSVHVDFVPTPYYDRNPNLLRTRGSYEALRDEANAVNIVWPVRPNPGTNRAYQFGIDRPDGTLAKFTSVCAPLIYRGDRLPADMYGNVIVAEPAANVVSRIVLNDDGSTLVAKKAYEKGELVASTDERFRPVYLSNAPDGTLYIVDMYRGVIQQRADITEYLRDHIVKRKLEEPTNLGRIYRLVHESTRRDAKPSLSKATPAQLVALLSSPNGWRRDTAQRLLVERGARAEIPALKRLAETAADPRTRLHALWTLDGIDAIEVSTVAKALEDTSRDVRSSALRLSERWLSQANHPIHAAVLKRLDDRDWAVQQQLAATVGVLPAGPRENAIASVIGRYGNQPIVLDAALSGARGTESVVLDQILKDTTEQTPQREAAIGMLAAIVIRAGQDASMQTLFAAIADESRAPWVRATLLRGAESAVLGTALPGSIGRRGAAPIPGAPCPTCPGGRAGPGGAYAFPQAPATPPVRRVVRLGREPAAFSAMAARGGDLGTRATAVLERVEWPGKPGGAAPIPPLTAEEQTRFNAGQEVYKNICIACHQPDGRGQEKLAPSLVGSMLTLAAPEIPARILLGGKEGPIGLMPPVGSVLSDDQIAGVLTYIRREWGQDGTPVTPAAVKAVREQTTGRTRPWTHDELMKMATAGGRGGH
jgi:mono/diheme cytochrome c family protein/glucose/arabinose dehydrogenase